MLSQLDFRKSISFGKGNNLTFPRFHKPLNSNEIRAGFSGLKRHRLQKKKLGISPSFRCRGGGIRTPGTSRYNGFQDRRIRPLCHASVILH